MLSIMDFGSLEQRFDGCLLLTHKLGAKCEFSFTYYHRGAGTIATRTASIGSRRLYLQQATGDSQNTNVPHKSFLFCRDPHPATVDYSLPSSERPESDEQSPGRWCRCGRGPCHGRNMCSLCPVIHEQCWEASTVPGRPLGVSCHQLGLGLWPPD